MKYTAFFLTMFFGVVAFALAPSNAFAAPVIDEWSASPTLITDGDGSVLHLQAHNDGLYITCDIWSPTGDAIFGRVDTYGSD